MIEMTIHSQITLSMSNLIEMTFDINDNNLGSRDFSNFYDVYLREDHHLGY